MRRHILAVLICIVAPAAMPPPAFAEAGLSAAERTAIDGAARQTLLLTGVPAASVAVVRADRIVFTGAYGLARLDPPLAATPAMPFAIGSISKQFTAAAILLLVQDDKLSLDDKVAKFLPDLTRANEVTIRQLLSHTSGYQDFWPEDFSPIAFRQPTTPLAVAMHWGGKKLDFAPGTAWQYSNTGFDIAALIAEKAGGAPFFAQVKARILDPLGMTSAADYNARGIPAGGPTGYERYAFSPPRPAPLDRPGWSFGSGGLAMTAHDLALWDISLIDRSLLKQDSYAAMETETKLPGGRGTGYGLGLEVGTRGGHAYLEHSGEETGFVAENIVFPADRAAIAVLTNQDASRAARVIAQQIAGTILNIPPQNPGDAHAELVMSILAGLARGQVDKARLNDNAQSYFNAATLADYRASLAPMGPPIGLRERTHEDRGGMVFRVWDVTYPGRNVTVTTYEQPDGRLGQFLIVP